MNIVLRVMLVLGAVLTMFFILRRIRTSKVQIKDSVFWIFFSVLLLVLSLFPRLAFWAAYAIGFEAPINFVYLIILFVLITHQFVLTIKVSQLEACIKTLTQEVALAEKEKEETSQK